MLKRHEQVNERYPAMLYIKHQHDTGFGARFSVLKKSELSGMARVLACILWVSLAATHGKGELLEALVA